MNEKIVRRILNLLRNDVRGVLLTSVRRDVACRRICADMFEKLDLLKCEMMKSEPAHVAPTGE